jgi:penicillin-binding protein 1A
MANMGVAKDPVYITRIEDRNGRVLVDRLPADDGVAICSPENAALMLGMLKGVVDEGTAAGLRMKYHLYEDMAGKTGTTQHYTDGWFIGFTPSLLAGVWVGGDLQNIRFKTMSHGQGAASAMPIWAEFMKGVYEDEHWRSLREDTFALDLDLEKQLDCEDYQDKKPRQFRPIQKLKEKKLFKKLFRRKQQ